MPPVITMPQLDRAFAKARGELAQVGLLEADRCLDRIECMRSVLPLGCGGIFHRVTPMKPPRIPFV